MGGELAVLPKAACVISNLLAFSKNINLTIRLNCLKQKGEMVSSLNFSRASSKKHIIDYFGPG